MPSGAVNGVHIHRRAVPCRKGSGTKELSGRVGRSSLEMKRNAYLVTGVAGGIGSSIAARLLARGDVVIGTSRDKETADGWTHDSNQFGVQVDVSDFKATVDAVDAACSWCDANDASLRGGINCAGSVLLKPAHLTSRSEFDDVMTRNVTTSFSFVRAMAPALRKTGGSIVLMSSAAATIGLAAHEGIAAAKAAVAGLTRSAAATYAANGICVNAVAPGLVDTPLTKGITSHAAMLEASRELHPLGRIGRTEDVVPVIAWLLSDEGSWTTGQIIGVDGGLAAAKARAARRPAKETVNG